MNEKLIIKQKSFLKHWLSQKPEHFWENTIDSLNVLKQQSEEEEKSDVDADPEEEEESAEAHEDAGHGRYQQLLLQLTGELGRRHLKFPDYFTDKSITSSIISVFL